MSMVQHGALAPDALDSRRIDVGKEPLRLVHRALGNHAIDGKPEVRRAEDTGSAVVPVDGRRPQGVPDRR